MLWLTKFVMRSLESASRLLPARKPKHLLTGKRGRLRRRTCAAEPGVRSLPLKLSCIPYDRGEIDLIGWDDGILCFIEVKTRTNERWLRHR